MFILCLKDSAQIHGSRLCAHRPSGPPTYCCGPRKLPQKGGALAAFHPQKCCPTHRFVRARERGLDEYSERISSSETSGRQTAVCKQLTQAVPDWQRRVISMAAQAPKQHSQQPFALQCNHCTKTILHQAVELKQSAKAKHEPGNQGVSQKGTFVSEQSRLSCFLGKTSIHASCLPAPQCLLPSLQACTPESQ